MLVKDLKNCEEIIAGDRTVLKELLNPLKEKIPVRYSLAHARLTPGQVSLAHKLKSSEVYYILEGQGEIRRGSHYLIAVLKPQAFGLAIGDRDPGAI